ncbi:Chitin synthase 2 [Mactra antiquata]
MSKRRRSRAFVNPGYQEDDGKYKISDDDDDFTSDDTATSDEGSPEIHFTANTNIHLPNESVTSKSFKRKGTKKIRNSNKWDVFRETSADNVTSSDVEFWETVFKVTKVVFAIFLFIFVLGTAVISKSTFSLLIANIFPPNSDRNSSLKTSNYHYQYKTTKTAATYIWSVFLIVVAPYFFTTFTCCWRLTFKKIRPLEFKPLLVAILIESFHSVGISLFIFVLLPNMDPVAGLLFSLNVAICPTILKLIYTVSL